MFLHPSKCIINTICSIIVCLIIFLLLKEIQTSNKRCTGATTFQNIATSQQSSQLNSCVFLCFCLCGFRNYGKKEKRFSSKYRVYGGTYDRQNEIDIITSHEHQSSISSSNVSLGFQSPSLSPSFSSSPFISGDLVSSSYVVNSMYTNDTIYTIGNRF